MVCAKKRRGWGRKTKTPDHTAKSDHAERNAEEVAANWSARVLRAGSLTGPAPIEFAFPTQGDGISHLRRPYSELRHPKTLLDQFSNLLPIFPTDVDATDTARTEFIRELVSSAASSIELLPTQTGFVDKDTFVNRIGRERHPDCPQSSIRRPHSITRRYRDDQGDHRCVPDIGDSRA
jgi:hypothetical protein